MIPGKNQITIIQTDVYGLQGHTQGFVRVQSDGIFIGENRSVEMGITWPDLLRLLEHPDVSQELAAHSVGFSSETASPR